MALKLILVSVKGTIVNPNNVVEHQVAKDLGKLAADLHGKGVKIALWSNQSWTCDNIPLHEYIQQFAGVPIHAHGVQWDGSPQESERIPLLLS